MVSATVRTLRLPWRRATARRWKTVIWVLVPLAVVLLSWQPSNWNPGRPG